MSKVLKLITGVSIAISAISANAQWQMSGTNTYFTPGKVTVGPSDKAPSLFNVYNPLNSGANIHLAAFYNPSARISFATTSNGTCNYIYSSDINFDQPKTIMLYSGGATPTSKKSHLELNASGYVRLSGYGEMLLLAGGKVSIGTGTSTGDILMAGTNNSVVIGGINPTVNGVKYKLAVKGKVAAQEIVVTATGWADYVLKNDYNLKPLSEVEKHIKAKGHLEGIPTEKEVLASGVSVGDMQVKLLAKVEELTLYMIDLQKENEKLKNKVSVLEKAVN